jgi:hypothetical protein
MAGFRSTAYQIFWRTICCGERTKSMHPLSIALSGISGCWSAVGFCATLMPPTSLMPHSAAVSRPESAEQP